MPSPISRLVEWVPGQSSMLHPETCNRLRVPGGRLKVRPAPEWLVERMVTRDAMYRYRMGGGHGAPRRGHVTATAMDSAGVAEVTQACGSAVLSPRFRR